MRRLAFFLVLALAAWARPGEAGARSLAVLSDYWCPYACLPGNAPGYLVEIVTAVLAPLGIEAVYEPAAWEDAIRLTAVGKKDALLGCTKTETPNLVFPKTPLAYSGNAFFVMADSKWNYAGVDSLRQGRLGISFGYDYGEEINAYVHEHSKNVITASTSDPIKEGLRNLSLGRIDYLIGDPAVIAWTAGTMGLAGRIRNAGSLAGEEALYVGFNPHDPDSLKLAEQFDKGLQALRASGEMGRIAAKYGLTLRP